MLLRTGAPVPGTEAPEHTGAKLLRRWVLGGGKEQSILPPLDVEALKKKYGPQRMYEPRLHTATFQVPLGALESTFDREKQRIVGRWLERMKKQGWHWVSEWPVDVQPGVYPAWDLKAGVAVLDKREYRVRAWFRQEHPKVIRTELKPEWLKPLKLR